MFETLTLIIASFGLFLAPGPTNAILAAAASTGQNVALKLLIAQFAGYLLAIVVALFVVGPMIGESAKLALALKFIAAIYLIFIAYRLWYWKACASAYNQAIGVSDVFITTVFNPKVLIFAFGIISPSQINLFLLITTLLCVVPLTGFLWLVIGSQAKRLPINHFTRTCSVALGLFALGIVIMATTQSLV